MKRRFKLAARWAWALSPRGARHPFAPGVYRTRHGPGPKLPPPWGRTPHYQPGRFNTWPNR